MVDVANVLYQVYYTYIHGDVFNCGRSGKSKPFYELVDFTSTTVVVLGEK